MINWNKVEEDIFTMVNYKKIIEYFKSLIEKEYESKDKDKRINRVIEIIKEITIKYLGCNCLNKTAKKYFYEVAKSILIELNNETK